MSACRLARSPVCTILYVVTCLCLAYSVTAAADWNVVAVTGDTAQGRTTIARTTNEAGYALEIYRDTNDAIRARLSMSSSLLNLADRTCPTYQIDRGKARNRSINDAPCISQPEWAEFVLGYVDEGVVESSTLRGLMLGINITFRFVLESGDYRETVFSLSGSMRAMQTAFGQNITVTEPAR